MIRVMMMSLYKFYVYIHTENETQRILALKAFFFPLQGQCNAMYNI